LEQALVDLFADLDAERFREVAARLDPHVELADELSGGWLRGRAQVEAYLRAQQDAVTDIRSDVRSISPRWLESDVGVVTFVVEQRYALDGVRRAEVLTGTTIFAVGADGPRLLLLHLGH
jgi:hypothetical protein